MGTGKTKFTEGILKYLGLESEISSPTFTIVNEYNAKNKNIYHFDIYRLKNINEFYEIGGDEYFGKGVCIIEWGELIEKILPSNTKKIEFLRDDSDDNIRILKLYNFDDINL